MLTAAVTRSVVVGVDGSEPSMTAVVWAARAAALRHADLLVLHVHDPDVPRWQVTDLLCTARRQAQKVDPQVRLRVRAVIEDVDTALIAVSAEAELLVLGLDTHASRGSHGLRGPLEDRVANHAVCPVVLVPGPGSRVSRPDVIALVTGDSPGMCAALIAAQEAARRQAALYLYVRELEGNPSAVELTDRAMLEITFDHPELSVRLKLLGTRESGSVAWEPVGRLALVVSCTGADTDPWAIRSDPYGTLLARRLRVPVMLVTPLAVRSPDPTHGVAPVATATA